jgi:DNA-binding MarR family transcriptional regulator
VNGLELFLLGRRLMKIGEEAIERAGFHDLPTSVRTILIDVFEHQDTSIGEITARTGFPQSHVSASVARLREGGVLVTAVDLKDRRRTLVRTAPEIPRQAANLASAPIDDALVIALATRDPSEVARVLAALELIAGSLPPLGEGRVGAGDQHHPEDQCRDGVCEFEPGSNTSAGPDARPPPQPSPNGGREP